MHDLLPSPNPEKYFFTKCDIRSIQGPKLKKIAKNLIIGIYYINYAYLINYAWPLTMAKR